jgi:hypothetical protein
MHYPNVVFVHQRREIASALRIQRVSQRKRRYTLLRQIFQFSQQWRSRPQRNVNVVAPLEQAMGQVREMAFATSE